MSYTETIGSRTYRFADLKTLLAKASPLRSGDQLAGIAAASEEERVAAKMALALATGDDATFKATATQSVNNGSGDIPSVLLKPVAVTVKNIADTVIKDGFTTKAKICIDAAASKCPL